MAEDARLQGGTKERGFNSSAQTPTVSTSATTAMAGSYYVTVTINGSTSAAGATVVTVNAVPATSAITGNGSVAIGQGGKLYSVTATSGSSYAWTVPSGASITAGGTGPNNSQITVTFGGASGDVTATETTAAGCVGSAVSLAVSVGPNHAPVVPDIGADVRVNHMLVLSVAKLLRRVSDADGDMLSVTAAGPASAHGPANNVFLDSVAGTMGYTPATNYVGTDGFAYTVSDGKGGTAIGTVNVTVTSDCVLSPDIVSGPSYDPGSGTFRVIFAGIPGYTYRVQYAIDPTGPWTPLKTGTAGTNGLFEVTDTQAPPPPARYYRTVYP